VAGRGAGLAVRVVRVAGRGASAVFPVVRLAAACLSIAAKSLSFGVNARTINSEISGHKSNTHDKQQNANSRLIVSCHRMIEVMYIPGN